jgi:UDP-N-acetylglucosamine--N-acetylmuramyl-(pentapeptide) pyrophosphoryl-undecaprenol N-acetylglucosamine transferase
MITDSRQPVILAAGGTGGHIFPAEALAEALIARGERVILVTDRRFANFKSGALSRIETRTIHAGTVGGSLYRKAAGAAGLALGIVQARKLLRGLQPKIAVGFGGYPSFPTMFAASGQGIPTLIHEQNSVLGRANRLLAPRVQKIATSFPATMMVADKDQDKLFMTGNPVRASVRALKDVPYPSIGQDGKMHILVTGGSQGASVFSQIVPAAVAALPAVLRARVRIDQQCREADLDVTRAAYQHLGVNADLAAFFVDLPARLAGSHLVIARSGASTVSELAAAGRPAILVPLPTAMDNHQYFNANAFEDVGGGWVMMQDGFTAASLAARLEAFLTAPETLSRAAHNAHKLGSPDAAQKLADLVLSVASGQSQAAGDVVQTDTAPRGNYRMPLSASRTGNAA